MSSELMRTLLLSISLLLCLWTNSIWAAGLTVSINGLEGAEKSNVEQSLSIRQLLKDYTVIDKVTRKTVTEIDDRSVARLPRLHKAANQEIIAALQPFGFYRPTITSSLKLSDTVWQAIYTIDLGEPVLLNAISVDILGDGQDEPAIRSLINTSPLKTGLALSHKDYASFKTSLTSAATEAGYLDSSFVTSSLRVDPVKLTADVLLTLDTGARYFFGDVSFEQSVLTSERVVSYIPFESGDVFNATLLIDLQLALGDSQYFKRVDIYADHDQAINYRIPVVIEAVPASPRQYSLAFGYGTDTGPRMKLGAEFRRINQRGHRIRTDLLLSAIKRSASISYEIPLGRAGVDSLRFLSRYEDEEIGDGVTQRFVLGVSYNDTWRTWQRRLYLNYTQEDFEFGENINSVRYLTPGVTLSYTKADNVLLPHAGYSWLMDLHGASGSVVSDGTFLSGRVVGQRVWSPAKRLRLLSKVELGATRVEQFDELPTSSRFFAGGDRSVRGYRYQSIGPVDEEGNTIGGSYLATASVEADYLFYKDFGGAVFADMGDASNSASFDFKRAAGIGFRWGSPVGMFRLDVASPLDDPDSTYRLHISIGADL